MRLNPIEENFWQLNLFCFGNPKREIGGSVETVYVASTDISETA
jgi:hypothetical protein